MFHVSIWRLQNLDTENLPLLSLACINAKTLQRKDSYLTALIEDRSGFSESSFLVAFDKCVFCFGDRREK